MENLTKKKETPTPFIHFFLTYKCNYRCDYCTQNDIKKREDSNASDDVVNAFIELLTKLDRKWEIHLMGGEALIHPRFFEVIEAIISSGHSLSLVTNFSFPVESYKKIVDICGNNLSTIFASLHLSQVKSIDEFINKAIELNSYKSEETKFRVLSVLTEENFETLKNIKSKLNKASVNVGFQRLRLNNKNTKYSQKIEDYLEETPYQEAKFNDALNNVNIYGMLCSAGHKFFYITNRGDVRRCYTIGQKGLTWLGNIKDKTFKPFKRPMPCLTNNCRCCSLIMKINMIDFGRKNYLQAIFYSLFSSFSPSNIKHAIKEIKNKTL